MLMTRSVVAAACAVTLLALWPASAGLLASPDPAEKDLAEARSLFEANLDAIRQRDREAYLACYLESPGLARAGAAGLTLGFEDHARQSTDDSWPDLFEGTDLQLVAIRPGVVYGTYRYRVQYGETEDTGLSERIFVKTPDGWRIAMTSAFSSPAGTPPPPRALAGATLVDGTGAAPVTDSMILLRGGKISCAGTRADCPVPEGVETLELPGRWIVPGLVDAHVHFSQTGWADGRPDALDVRDAYPYEQVEADLRTNPRRFFSALLCSGVTAVFDVGGYPWTWGLRGPAETDTRAPHVEAAGPLLSTLDHWLNLPAERQFIFLEDEESAAGGVSYLAAHGTGAVKVWFIARSDGDFDRMAAAVMAAGREARGKGIPLIVHATGLREAKVALRAGARLLVHSVDDAPVDDEFISLARQAETIYCPTLTVRDGYAAMYRAAVRGTAARVDDPGGCVDPGLLDRIASTKEMGERARAAGLTEEALSQRTARWDAARETMLANLKRVHAAGIPVAMGTDAGNPLTLHGPSVHAEMEAMQEAGLTPAQVLEASTRVAAAAMGRAEDLGTIEPGKVADLLVLSADPTRTIENMRRLEYVIRGGEVRPASELAARRP